MFYYKRTVNTPNGTTLQYVTKEHPSNVPCNIEITEEEYNAAMRVPNLKKEMQNLKEQLAATDYIACKIAEGSATIEEYSEEIQERRSVRARINEIETELSGLVE